MRVKSLVSRGEGQLVVGGIPGQAAGFIDRDQVEEVERALIDAGTVLVCAVAGCRGVGKTQVAAAVARSAVARGWGLVAWVSGETRDALLAGLALVAEGLGVADPERDAVWSATRLRAELQSRQAEGLLVVDNATDLEALTEWLPATGGTRVVVTSTDRNIISRGSRVDVGVFTRPESIRYLQGQAGRDDPAGVELVARAVEDSPLGLSQAAAVLRTRPSLTCAELARRIDEEPLARSLPREKGCDYPKGVAEAILQAVDLVIGPDATPETDPTFLERVLLTVAVLSPTGVSLDLLVHILAPGEEDLDSERRRVEDALAVPVGASLLERSEDGTAVLMHRLIAHALRDRSGPYLGELLVEIGERLGDLIPGEPHAWQQQTGVAPSAEHIVHLWTVAVNAPSLMDREGIVERLVPVQRRAIQHLIDTAGLRRATAISARTLSDTERVLGVDHPDTFASRDDLADAYEAADDVGRAISLFEAVLADRQRVLGADHPDTFTSRDNLAHVYMRVGDPGRAISMHEATLADRQRVLGADHPDTFTSRDNLAGAYSLAGDLGQAIPLYEAIIVDRQRVLGADHHDTFASRRDLVDACEDAGDLERVILLCEAALTDTERVLGVNHLDAYGWRYILIEAYESSGVPGRAIPLREANLAFLQRVLGADHPDTFTSRDNLAGAYETAEQAHERPLASSEEIRGQELH